MNNFLRKIRRRNDRVRPSASRRARAGIWVLSLAVLVVGIISVGHQQEQMARDLDRIASVEVTFQADPATTPSLSDAAPSVASRSDVAATDVAVVTPVAVKGGVSSPGAFAEGSDCQLNDAGAMVCTEISDELSHQLPAWRWSQLGELGNQNSSLGGIFNSIVTTIAGLMFFLANAIWRVMLLLVSLAASRNWLVDSAYTVSLFFRKIGPAALVGASLAWFVVLARSGKMALKADLIGILRTIIVFLVPIGFLFATYMASGRAVEAGAAVMGGATGNGYDCGSAEQPNFSQCDPGVVREAGVAAASVPGSPVYLAVKVQSIFDTVGSTFGDILLTGVGGRQTVEGGVLSSIGSEQIPNCGDYIASIFKGFESESTDAGSSQQQRFNIVTTHASMAWVAGLYEPWAEANFGESQLKGVSACHLLEETNGVDVTSRQAVMGNAYKDTQPGIVSSITLNTSNGVKAIPGAGHESVYQTTFDKSFAVAKGGGKDQGTILDIRDWGGLAGNAIGGGAKAAVDSALGPALKFLTMDDSGDNNDSKELVLRLSNWAACRWNGSAWVADPRWIAVSDTSIGVQDGMTDAEIYLYSTRSTSQKAVSELPSSPYCTTRWVYGHGEDPNVMDGKKEGKAGEVVSADKGGINGALGTVVGGEVRNMTTKHGVDSEEARAAYDNYFGRSPANRMVYAVVALGGSIAYFLLIGGPSIGLLLATLSLIVLLSLFPIVLVMMAAGMDAGQKAFRMMIGFMGSKTLFAILILGVVEMQFLTVAILKSINTNLDSGQAGFTSSILVMASPLAVIWVVNRLLKAMGLGKITSLKGSTGLIGDMANKASRSKGFFGGDGGGKRFGNGVKGLGSKAGKVYTPKALRSRDEKKGLRHANRSIASLNGKIGALEAKGTRTAAEQAELDKLKRLKHSKEQSRNKLEAAIAANEDAYKNRGAAKALRGGAFAAMVAKAPYDGVAAHTRQVIAERNAVAIDAHRNAIAAAPEDELNIGVADVAIANPTFRQDNARTLQQAVDVRVDSARASGSHISRDVALAEVVVQRQIEMGGNERITNGSEAFLRDMCAQSWGVDRKSVMCDDYGNCMLDPSAFEDLSTVPAELRDHPVMHLPSQIRTRRKGETKRDHATRLMGVLIATGYAGMDANGSASMTAWDTPPELNP